MDEEVLQVTRKYSKLKRPVYARRQEAIAQVPEFWFRVVSERAATQLCA